MGSDERVVSGGMEVQHRHQLIEVRHRPSLVVRRRRNAERIVAG
jgi:hypothetical protein